MGMKAVKAKQLFNLFTHEFREKVLAQLAMDRNIMRWQDVPKSRRNRLGRLVRIIPFNKITCGDRYDECS